ncbi:MAG: putative C-S lyase, partial [Anaerolineae bacterium]|nr:putative C-S lyase [Anaerolineae bacterium]
MRYDFDHLPDRRLTDSVKWNQFEPDVLPLWVADMDYPVADPIRRALRERVDEAIYGYPDVFSNHKPIAELREVIVERMLRLYDWKVATEEVVILPGVIVGLNLACQSLAVSRGSVLVQTPVYPPFLGTAQNANMKRHEAVLEQGRDGYYEINWETFERAITERTRLFILCNPHNPVGRVFRKDELERMAEICLRKEVVICSDEIHCDLVFKRHRHIPIATLGREVAQNTITLMAPTKTFNIAGLQCSFAIIQNQELRRKFVESMRGLVMWVNLMGLRATLAAYRDGQEWLDQALNYLESNRDYLTQYVREQLPSLHMMQPEGTYLGWLDCRKAGI